jgi:hypothetical protein
MVAAVQLSDREKLALLVRVPSRRVEADRLVVALKRR